MKTKIITIVAGLILIAVPGAFALNTGYTISDEPYVDDIPFNTGKIAESCRILAAFYLPEGKVRIKEEAYVDDIPFDTKTIADSYETSARFCANRVNLPDEAYVNDIPFNTASIAGTTTALNTEQIPETRKDVRFIKIRIRKPESKQNQYIIDLVSGRQDLRNYTYSLPDQAVVKVLLVN